MQTDAEVVAGFMDPPPSEPLDSSLWWSWEVSDGRWTSIPSAILNSLDALRLVEARFTDEQWKEYWWALADSIIPPGTAPIPRLWLHASAQDKLKALAAVLRKEESK